MSESDVARLLDEEAELAEKHRDVERSYVRARPAASPSQVYSLRIPVERLEQLRNLAERHHEAPTAMMRRWVLERLERELARAVRREPPVRSDELVDPETITGLKQLLEHIAATSERPVDDTLTDSLRKLHRQLYATLEAFAETAAGHEPHHPPGPDSTAPSA